VSDVVIGSTEFKADLDQFNAAITQVSQAQDGIVESFRQLRNELANVESTWLSPAGTTYSDAQQVLNSSISQMLDVLDQMVSRMKVTLQNYQQAEQANTQNLT
jgi:WXG100 family type VII secretion target